MGSGESLITRLLRPPRALGNSGRLLREVVRARVLGARSGERADGGVHLDHLEAVAQREGEDTVHRLRSATHVAMVLWPTFGLLDWLVARGDGELLRSLLLLRLIGIALSVGAWLSLRKAAPASPWVFGSRVVTFVVSCILMAFMSSRIDGIAGAYAPGIMLASMLRASFVAEPWRRGVWTYLLMWLAFPGTLLAAAPFDARIAAQLADPDPLADFALHNFFCFTAVLTGVACSDALWRLRREAYEARHLGRYRLKQRIARGGMGEVWVAHHLGLKRDIALKVLSAHGRTGEREAVVRFEREVQAIGRLSHPNTVRILDHGVTPEGIWFYAMELLHGSDLGALLKSTGALSPERAIQLLSQACSALAEAHDQGVIHRDLKPSNLFVAELGGSSDFVKVLDFGLAKLTHEADAAQLTRDDAVVGTPSYIAPETLQHGEVSPRSDVYALGCVLYEMLAGRPPFEQRSLRELLHQHVEQAPEPPSSKRGEALPPGLDALVLRCLAKNPKDRFADAAELGAALALVRAQ